MNPVAAAIALAVAAAVGAWSAHAWTSAEFEAEIAEKDRKAQIRIDDANARAAKQASDYEMWKANNQPRTVTITREVERAVQADSDCSQRAMPAGLRDSLTAAAAGTDQPVLDRAMPAASSASAYDLGGAGTRLRGLAGRASGLSRAASSAR